MEGGRTEGREGRKGAGGESGGGVWRGGRGEEEGGKGVWDDAQTKSAFSGDLGMFS